MKKTLKIDGSTKIHKSGVKSQDEAKKCLSNEVNQYRKKIIEMTNQIEDERFLNQIRTILKRHIEKRGS